VPVGVATAACTKRSNGVGEEVRDGATGSGTATGTPPAASRPKVGSGQGWRRRWRDVEGGGGGTEGGGVDGAASREAAV
jgi:hypothetical protein